MKMVMIGGAAAMLAGGAYVYKDGISSAPNVYPMPAAALYSTLNAMQIEQSPQGPMGTLDITKHASEPSAITWSGSNAHTMVDCTATLTPLDAARTRVDTQCGGGGPSEGAAAGMGAKILQIKMVEQIDSILRGRPYDKQKVEMAGVGLVLRNMPKMQSDALNMSRNEQERRAAEATQASNPQPGYTPVSEPSQPGQPTDPQGTDPQPTTSLN